MNHSLPRLFAVFALTLAACAESAPPAAPLSVAAEAALDELILLDRPGAIAAYDRAGPQGRARLWQAHLGRARAGLVLDREQAAILAEVERRLPDLTERYDATLAARAEAAFTPPQLAELFEFPGALAPVANIGVTCETRWCSCNYRETEPICFSGCETTSSGCGWFLQESCTRSCQIGNPEEVEAIQ